MSRYNFIIYIFLLFFTNCSASAGNTGNKIIKNINYLKSSKKISTIDDKKLKADFYYLSALDCEYNKDFNCAEQMYKELYILTKQKIFLINASRFALFLGDYQFFKQNLKILQKESKKNSELASLLIPYYLKNKEIKKAQKLAKELIKKSPTEKNYEILAAIYTDTAQYQKAKKLINNYIKKYGCAIKLCAIKLLINAREEDVDESIKTLRQLYQKTKNPVYEVEIAKLLLATKQLDRLEKFFANSPLPNKDLLEIYSSMGLYYKAEELAYKLYKKTKDEEFLATSAIYLYESKYKTNPSILKEVIKRFEKSVYKLNKPLYYNYYGYLLIDHNINIKKGIKLVKKALEFEPESEYYLDSLGWGYYKLGDCKKAYKIFEKLKDYKQEEIQEHIKRVKECLKK